MKKRMRVSWIGQVLLLLLVTALSLVGCAGGPGGVNVQTNINVNDGAVVKQAMEMESQLYGQADTYDALYAGQPMQAAINWWAYNVCGLTNHSASWPMIVASLTICSLVAPGVLGGCSGGTCTVTQEGSLQCVEFVTGAFGAIGDPLPASGNGNQFWGNYQNRQGWTEVSPDDISSGKAVPQLGDIIGFTNSNPFGHVGIVIAVQPQQGGNAGKVVVAGGNQGGNLSDSDRTKFGLPRGNFYELTWDQHGFQGYPGDVVQGFIRQLGYSSSAGSISVQYVPSGNGQQVNVTASLTWYGFGDNSGQTEQQHGSADIAYPKNGGNHTLHNRATEGSGTYDDPITFAARTNDQQTFPIGSVIYVPLTQKYYIMEDQCGDNDPQGCLNGTHHTDLWMGPPTLSSGSALGNCESKGTPGGPVTVVINPSPSLPVDTTPEFNNGQCSLVLHSSG